MQLLLRCKWRSYAGGAQMQVLRARLNGTKHEVQVTRPVTALTSDYNCTPRLKVRFIRKPLKR